MPLAPFGIVTFNDLDAAIDLAAKKPACLARQITTTQSLVNNTFTTMTYNSVEFDNDAIAEGASGSILEVSRSGLWVVSAVISYVANSTGVREVTIRVNGATPSVGAPVKVVPATPSPDLTLMEIRRTFEFTAGQQVDIRGRQTSGGALSAFLAEFSLHLVTDA